VSVGTIRGCRRSRMNSLARGLDGVRPWTRKGAGYVRHDQNRTRRLRRSGTVLLVIVAAGLMLAACGSDKGSGAKSTTSTVASTGSSTTKAPTDSTTTAPAPPATTPATVPFSVSEVHTGTGPATLGNFNVSSQAKEWDIDWVYYGCPAPAKTGTFGITVVGHGSAANTTDGGVTEPAGPGTAGIDRNYDTGTFNLKVTTACKWTVRVEVLT
jgi:hypothetical protein